VDVAGLLNKVADPCLYFLWVIHGHTGEVKQKQPAEPKPERHFALKNAGDFDGAFWPSPARRQIYSRSR